MKRILIIGSLLLMILAGCSAKTSDKKEMEQVYTTSIMQKMDNKETFFFVVASSTCSACIAYKPVLQEFVANKDFNLLYVEVDTEGSKSEADRANVLKLFEEYLDDTINLTPTTVFIKDGVLEDYIVGQMKYTELIAWVESK